ncbi:MAG: (2Fe-2S)-binding protein [Pararhizobium sp.]
MNENPDTGGWPASPWKEDVQAAVAWQAQRFPQVAASVGDDADLSSVSDTWRKDSTEIADLLDYQSRFAAGMDDRTKGAHLVAFYSHQLSIAAGAIYLRTGLVPDLDPGSLAIRFEPYAPKNAGARAQVCPSGAHRFHFRFRQFRQGPDSASLFHDSFVASLAPVVETVKAHTGLTSVAQWRLAADGIAGAFLEIGAASAQEEQAMASALAIVNTQSSLLSSSVLRYQKIAAIAGGVPVERIFRLRSGCCLYYRTDGGAFCDVCVLLDEETQKSRLRAHLERAGG